METEYRFPLLGQRAPGLPPVPVNLDRPFGSLGKRKRGDPAPARVTGMRHVSLIHSSRRPRARAGHRVEDRPAVVQRLLPCLGQRDLGIRPEPDRGQAALDPDALTPCLRDAARRRPVDPEAQAPSAVPVPVDAGSADCADERGGERSRSFGHAFLPQSVYHLLQHYTGKNIPDLDGLQGTDRFLL